MDKFLRKTSIRQNW